MASPAGIVNRDGRASDEAFRRILDRSLPEVRDLALATRDLVYEVLPETVEVVWTTQRSVGWGTGERKFSEQFCYLMPFKAHVTLGFYHGAELPDPDGLLPDTGGTQAGGRLSMRSLKIASVEQLRNPALRALIESATRTGVPTVTS
jgi:hypothetical protein